MKRLDNKIAVVMGAGGGMAGATCKRFAAEGAVVICVDLFPDTATLIVNEIIENGGKAEYLKCDCFNEEEVEKLFAGIEEKYGRLDIAFNGMGGQVTSPFVMDTPMERCREIIDGNLITLFIALKHEARLMAKHGGGAIVNISSINAAVPNPRMAFYCAAKAGLDMLVKSMAMEVGPMGIRVNNIQPGFTNTARGPQIMLQNKEILGEILYKTPTRRITQPENIAAAAAFLVSDDASNITAVTLAVDGGEATEGYPDSYEILKGLPRTVVVD